MSKDKIEPTAGHEGLQEEYKYIFTLSLTPVPSGDGWSTPRHPPAP